MPYDLTTRELQLVRLAAAGHTDGQIGDALIISVLTVAAHLSNIAAKMGVATRDEVVARAKEEGL